MQKIFAHKVIVMLICLLFLHSLSNGEIFSRNIAGNNSANPCNRFYEPSIELNRSSNPLEKLAQIPTELLNTVVSNFESKLWKRGNKYLIVITVADGYPNSDWNNSIADLEGEQIAKIFGEFGYKSLGSDMPIVLNGKEVSRTKLRKTIKSCVKNGNENKRCPINGEDTLLIYIIAHGQHDNSKEFKFFIPGTSDYSPPAGSSQPIGFSQQADAEPVTFPEIISWLQPDEEIAKVVPDYKDNFHKTFIILDTCHSGQAMEGEESIGNTKKIGVFVATSKTGESGFLEKKTTDSTGNSKTIHASAFSWYLTRALNEEWDFADENRDGILKYGELKKYLKMRLTCSQQKNEFKAKTNEPMNPMTGLYNLDDEVIAFRREKITSLDTSDWFPYHDFAEKLEESLMILKGNVNLLENRDYFKTSTLAKADIDKYNSSIEQIVEQTTELKWDIDKNSYEFGVKLLAGKKIDESIAFLTELETSNQEQPEEFYLVLGLAQRYKGGNYLSQAVETYLRGLQKFPISSKIMIARASTLIYISGDPIYKDSLSQFLQAVELELKINTELSEEILKSIEDFRSQLKFLNRLGDLDKFDQDLDILKKQYKKYN